MTTLDPLLTFDPLLDSSRASRLTLLGKVFHVLYDGNPHTLAAIAARTGGSSASVSARIRDFRKPRYGGHHITRQHIGGRVYEYTLRRS